MKKLSLVFLLLLSWAGYAQQMPYYTQYKNNQYLINPAITGTKRLIDARIGYRTQWVGYVGAPKTTDVSVNSRFFKGKMGAGIYLMQDKIAAEKSTNLGVSYAYHIRFPDCELSAGLAGNFTKFTVDGTMLDIHNSQDPSINQYITNSTWTSDLSAGIYLYNDRFHVGLSGLHTLSSTAELYKDDTLKKGLNTFVPHVYFTLGYNYAQNIDYIWESTVYANYTKGAPFFLDYTLRLHYKQKIFGGISLRLHDAIALHVGMSFLNDFQVAYSYDIQIGGLKAYNSGSHEIMIVYSSNIFKTKHRGFDDRFLHQRYGYLF